MPDVLYELCDEFIPMLFFELCFDNAIKHGSSGPKVGVLLFSVCWHVATIMSVLIRAMSLAGVLTYKVVITLPLLLF